MQNPDTRDLPVNTRTRANILWNLQKDIQQTVGGENWQPFQEKVGVFGMRRRIPLFPGFFFEIGIVARSEWRKFDMNTRNEFTRNLGVGVFLDESLVYQGYFCFGGSEALRTEKLPRIVKSSKSHFAVLRSLKKFTEQLRKAV